MHRSHPAFRRAAAAAVALLAAASAPARGQTPAGADSASRDSAYALEPVRVTVLRTPFDLSRAPFAISVLGAAELQRGRPGFNLAEALVAVPGVQVENRYNYALGERISVRGFGARAQFGVRGVRVLVDGIPATMPDGQTTLNHVDVSSLGRAEVVRGPSAAIYGNASGGVLQLETEAPPDVPLAQRFRATGGADGLLRLQSTTAGRSAVGTTRVNYSLNLSRLDYDGYRAWQDASNTYAALSVGAGGPRTSVRLVGHLSNYDGHNPGALSDSLMRVDRTQAFRDNAVRWRAGEEGRHRQLGLAARHQLPRGELRASVYGLTRSLDNPIPQRVVVLDRRATGLRAAYGLPFTVAGRAVQLVAGAERDVQRDDRQNFVNDTGRLGALTLDQLERVTATAGYAQLAVDATQRLSVLGALRYDDTRFTAADRFVTATDADDSGRRGMRASSPSVGVSWRLPRGASLYANYATAFETPTTTELANRPSGAGGFNPDLEPQRTRSVEVGGRTPLFGAAALQLSLYRARVAGALIPFEVPGGPGRQFFRNAGSVEHRGVEAGATLVATRGVSLRTSYTYTDARFDEYVVSGVSFADKRVPGVAPHRADAVLTYAGWRGLVAELEERYLSAVPVADANPAGSDAPAYAVTNVRLSAPRARLAGVALVPVVGVTNLLDREYVGSVTVNAFGRRYYEPAPGRSLYVGLEVAAPGR